MGQKQSKFAVCFISFYASSFRGGQFTKSGLLFIATLAVRPHYQELFVGEGIIEMLLGNVIWPNVSYSDEDRDLLKDDPVAFFEHDLDGFDKETVRGAAVG